MTRGSPLLAGLATLLLLIEAAHPAYATMAPAITKVRFLQKQDSVTAKIFGVHFGKSPVKLPCNNCKITEMQLLYFGQGNEDFGTFNIGTWTDTYIELKRLAAAPGTTAIFAIKNDSLGPAGKTVTITANLPGGPAAPVIRRIAFFRDHQRLKLRVDGKGFGEAPAGVPGDTDLVYFQFWIWVTGGDVHNYPWAAGHNGDDVTLKYESWTDSRIVISGFGADYRGGSEDWVARPGDAVAVTLFNNPGGGAYGPSAGKASRIPW